MAFTVCKKGKCGLAITDISEYLDNPILATLGPNYAFTDSRTINVISTVDYEGNKEILNYDITTHYTTEDGVNVIDESEFEFGKDGLYEINHLILPTVEWYERYQTAVFECYDNVYIADDSKVYRVYNNNTVSEVSISELLEINLNNSTVKIESKNTFSLCHLLECFYNICKNLLSKLCPISCSGKSDYQDLILNRDIIWMAINAIRYSIELGLYFEALRLLLQIQGCNTICSQYENNNIVKGSGCGCNR